MDKTESFAVIGIGQFGSALCEALVEAGQEVLAIDSNEEVINDLAGSVMRAVIADAQDEEALKDLSIGTFDHVYVSIGKDIEASIMATLIAKDLGAKDVICRAENRNPRPGFTAGRRRPGRSSRARFGQALDLC